MTVSQLLSMSKIVRERLNELKGLRNQVAVRTRNFISGNEISNEPQYDVKIVDKKISELEKFLYVADIVVKASNAITTVEVSGVGTIDDLLAPLV